LLFGNPAADSACEVLLTKSLHCS